MYPVVPMVKPACLAGQSNGRLDRGLLVHVGPSVDLVPPAARGWRAMNAAATLAGVPLWSISSYRTYLTQVALFTERYTTRYLPGRPSRIWNGRRWYQKPGTAMTAVPGESNHGWALAVDNIGATRGSRRLAWLLANEVSFGFSHEVQSESWHVRWYAGDRVPRRVLEYEATTRPPPPPPEEDDMAIIITADQRLPRLFDAPAFVPLDGASLASARKEGLKEVDLTQSDYDELRDQMVRALGGTP